MAATELLSHLLRIDLSKLSNEEIMLLEADLFVRICKELKEIFRKQYKNYFCLMKFTRKMENIMLENNFIRFIIEAILATKEYDLRGIARYTDTPKEVLQEVYDGRNTNPSAKLLRKSIDLHRSVRPDLYEAIIKKIAIGYLHVYLKINKK